MILLYNVFLLGPRKDYNYFKEGYQSPLEKSLPLRFFFFLKLKQKLGEGSFPSSKLKFPQRPLPLEVTNKELLPVPKFSLTPPISSWWPIRSVSHRVSSRARVSRSPTSSQARVVSQRGAVVRRHTLVFCLARAERSGNR